MNEKILDALMRLFALITDPTDIANNKEARVVVEVYLRGIISPSLVTEYIERYDKYLNEYQDRKATGKATRKNISVNSVKVLKICELINQQLHHREKIYVLIQLMEYVCTDTMLSSREKEFVETVSQAFNIEYAELKNLEAFIEDDIKSAADPQSFLYIDSVPYSTGGVKHVTYPGLDGTLRILLIESISGFFFIYNGVPPVSINGHKVQNGKVYLVPSMPHGFIDAPISSNRIIGLWYLADIFYPEAGIDIVEKTREFYSLFYGADISAEQARKILHLD